MGEQTVHHSCLQVELLHHVISQYIINRQYVQAMLTQSHELMAILADVLVKTQLDNRERFRQMVLEEKLGKSRNWYPKGTRWST